MTDPRLTNYISQCRQLKMSNEDIISGLVSAGWPMEIIKEAFEKFSVKKILISIKNLSKEYTPFKNIKISALKDITLDIHKGEFLAITGRSGSGKSTLLNMIGLLDTPSSGEILIGDKNVSKFNEKEMVGFRLKFISFIFQFFNLIENYTAFENIMFQLWLQGYSHKISKQKAEQIIEFLGLKDKAKHYPKELSGGEQQRIAVGRALAKDSLIVLADEPTAHLDSMNSEIAISLLRDINVKFGKTVVLVTHEENYAAQADRIITLQDGKMEIMGRN